MYKLLVALVILVFSTYDEAFGAQALSKARGQNKNTVVDELLFDLTDESFTQFDFKNFEEIYYFFEKSGADQTTRQFLSYFRNQSEVYVFSKLALKEAQQLDIKADPELLDRLLKDFKFPKDLQKKEYLKNEIQNLLDISELIKVKERQFSQRQAVMTWLAVLKRKYSFSWKSNEFKNSVSLGI